MLALSVRDPSASNPQTARDQEGKIQELQRTVASKDSVIRNLHETAADCEQRLARLRKRLWESGVHPDHESTIRNGGEVDLEAWLTAVISELDRLRVVAGTTRALQAVPRPDAPATVVARAAGGEELRKAHGELATARFKITELEASLSAGTHLAASRGKMVEKLQEQVSDLLSQLDSSACRERSLQEQVGSLLGRLDAQVHRASLQCKATAVRAVGLAPTVGAQLLRAAFGCWIAVHLSFAAMKQQNGSVKHPHTIGLDVLEDCLMSASQELARKTLAHILFMWHMHASWIHHHRTSMACVLSTGCKFLRQIFSAWAWCLGCKAHRERMRTEGALGAAEFVCALQNNLAWLAWSVWHSWCAFLTLRKSADALREQSYNRGVGMRTVRLVTRSFSQWCLYARAEAARTHHLITTSALVEAGIRRQDVNFVVNAWMAWTGHLQRPVTAFVVSMHSARILNLAWIAWRRLWTTAMVYAWQTFAFAGPQAICAVVRAWMAWRAYVRGCIVLPHTKEASQEWAQYMHSAAVSSFIGTASLRHDADLVKRAWVTWCQRCAMHLSSIVVEAASAVLKNVYLVTQVWRSWLLSLSSSQSEQHVREALDVQCLAAQFFHLWVRSIVQSRTADWRASTLNARYDVLDAFVTTVVEIQGAASVSRMLTAWYCHNCSVRLAKIATAARRDAELQQQSMLVEEVLHSWHNQTPAMESGGCEVWALQARVAASIESFIDSIGMHRILDLLRRSWLHWCCHRYSARLHGAVTAAMCSDAARSESDLLVCVWHSWKAVAKSARRRTILNGVISAMRTTYFAHLFTIVFASWHTECVHAASIELEERCKAELGQHMAVVVEVEATTRILCLAFRLWAMWRQHMLKTLMGKCVSSVIDGAFVRACMSTVSFVFLGWQLHTTESKYGRHLELCDSRAMTITNVSAILEFVRTRNPISVSKAFRGWLITVLSLLAARKTIGLQAAHFGLLSDTHLAQRAWMLWSNMTALAKSVARNHIHIRLLEKVFEAHRVRCVLFRMIRTWAAWTSCTRKLKPVNCLAKVEAIDGLTVTITRNHYIAVERIWVLWELHHCQARLTTANQISRRRHLIQVDWDLQRRVIYFWHSLTSYLHSVCSVAAALRVSSRRVRELLLEHFWMLWWMRVELARVMPMREPSELGVDMATRICATWQAAACDNKKRGTLFAPSVRGGGIVGMVGRWYAAGMAVRVWSLWRYQCHSSRHVRNVVATICASSARNQAYLGLLAWEVWRARTRSTKQLAGRLVVVLSWEVLQRCFSSWAGVTAGGSVTSPVCVRDDETFGVTELGLGVPRCASSGTQSWQWMEAAAAPALRSRRDLSIANCLQQHAEDFQATVNERAHSALEEHEPSPQGFADYGSVTSPPSAAFMPSSEVSESQDDALALSVHLADQWEKLRAIHELRTEVERSAVGMRKHTKFAAVEVLRCFQTWVVGTLQARAEVALNWMSVETRLAHKLTRELSLLLCVSAWARWAFAQGALQRRADVAISCEHRSRRSIVMSQYITSKTLSYERVVAHTGFLRWVAHTSRQCVILRKYNDPVTESTPAFRCFLAWAYAARCEGHSRQAMRLELGILADHARRCHAKRYAAFFKYIDAERCMFEKVSMRECLLCWAVFAFHGIATARNNALLRELFFRWAVIARQQFR